MGLGAHHALGVVNAKGTTTDRAVHGGSTTLVGFLTVDGPMGANAADYVF